MRSRLLAIAATGGESSTGSRAESGSEPILGIRAGVGLDSSAGGDEGVAACSPNVAVTSRARSIATVHVPVPEQPSPSQPANVDPDAGVAMSVTEVPCVKLAEQPDPQSMPAGLLVTVPLPPPEQPAPVQPVKAEPLSAVAVSLTSVPLV